MTCGLLSVPAVAAGQNITIRLEHDKTAPYLIGEPVVVNVVLRNAGNEPVSIPAELEPDYEVIRFFIKRADDTGSTPGRLFRPWAVIEDGGSRQLAPNDEIVVPSRIFYGAEGWTFRSEGTYTVTARFSNATSNALTIVVAHPADDAQRALGIRLIESNQAGRFLLLDGGDHLDDGLPLIRQLAATDSVLGGYAANALGLSQSKRYVNLRTSTVREANPIEALRLLQRGRTLLPEGYFRLENYQGLSKTYLATGRLDSAAALQRDYRAEIERARLSDAMKAHAQSIIRR